MSDPLRILAVATYPVLTAATRYRLVQYVPLLAEEGVHMDVRPFLSDRTFAGFYDRHRVVQTGAGILAGVARRLRDAFMLGGYDVLFVQREAAVIGPPLFEWLARHFMPMVLDLDDSTYVERSSEVFGALAHHLKSHGKTDRLIPWASHVICGNPTIAAYVERKRVSTTVVPTIVDSDLFRPRPAREESRPLIIGWMGTHSTYAYLRTLLPVFRSLSARYPFVLRIIGAGRVEPIEGVEAEHLPWRLEREVSDLQSFDVAVYPIVADAWAQGKSGFKSILYLSCGVPFVASPVGVVAKIGLAGETHFEARNELEWDAALTRLIVDHELRRRMGEAGRRYAVEHYSTRRSAAVLAHIFRAVAGKTKATR